MPNAPTPVYESAPEGWEDVAERLKGEPGVDNAFAVAHAMKNKGYQRHGEAGKPYDVGRLYRRYQHDQARESTSATALGALMRKGVQESAPPRLRGARTFSEFTRLREAIDGARPDGSIPVVLIVEGPGNKRDHNFYSAEALRGSYTVFDGVKCFLNHPSRTEEHDRPERDVRDICGWYANVRADMVEGRTGIVADLHFSNNDAGREAQALIDSDRRYRESNPDGVLIGFSINAEGESHAEHREGEDWNIVDRIDYAMSTDLVTFPAAGGKALSFREAAALVESCRFRASVRRVLGLEGAHAQ